MISQKRNWHPSRFPEGFLSFEKWRRDFGKDGKFTEIDGKDPYFELWIQRLFDAFPESDTNSEKGTKIYCIL